MPLIIKAKGKPHLALTHNELQGGAANGRNVSLLMKSDVELTPEITKALEALGINKSMYASKISEALSSAVREAFGDDGHWLYVEDYNDSIVLFCSEGGLFSTTYSLVDGKVTLGDLAKPMSRVISYEPETGEMLLSEDAEDKLEEGIYSLVTKALQNDKTKEHLVEMFKAQELKKSEVEILEQEIKKAVDAAEAILKAQLTAKETELTKALSDLEVFKAEKLEVVAKARKQAVAEFEKDEAKADELVKSLEALPQEAFDVVIKSLKEKVDMMENSDLFIKKSKNTDVDDVVVDNATAAILKAKYQKQ